MGCMQHAPWAPPLVEMSGGQVGHLLEWRQHERDGSWHAWVSWVLTTGDPPRHQHKVVSVQAESLAPLEEPDAVAECGGTRKAARTASRLVRTNFR